LDRRGGGDGRRVVGPRREGEGERLVPSVVGVIVEFEGRGGSGGREEKESLEGTRGLCRTIRDELKVNLR